MSHQYGYCLASITSWTIVWSLGRLYQLHPDTMARLSWVQVFLAATSLVSCQSSTSQADGLTTAAGTKTASYATATVNGSPTRYSVAFTVPAQADIGLNVLPNIKDPEAKQAQVLCPGYKASGVERTANGFTASLTLAGDPVSSCDM
jgi:alpha-glucosidase